MSGLVDSVAYTPIDSSYRVDEHDGGDIPSLSVVAPWDGYSVYVRNLNRWYGKNQILHGVNLTLPRGKIYGLLGPSGCGKTTLLKCLLGLLEAHGGLVKIFGQTPGKPGTGIPGKDVGLMPQELALYDEFSIYQNLEYYAKLFGISREVLDERTDFLIDFLKLPPRDRRASALSGGQRRRVSLAVSLLQKPKLLLLDEPTVGVDPALRTRIWEHLVKIAAEGTAVIITTHYIEEARLADFVGFMREGRILTEGSPDELMTRFNKTSLEGVFLHLCTAQHAAGGQDDDEDDDVLLGPVGSDKKSINIPAGRSINQRVNDRDDDKSFHVARLASPASGEYNRSLLSTTPDVLRVPLLPPGSEAISPVPSDIVPGSPMDSHIQSRAAIRAANQWDSSISYSNASLLKPSSRSKKGSDKKKPSGPTKIGYDDDEEQNLSVGRRFSSWCTNGFPRAQQVWAALWKNFTRMGLSWAFMVMVFLLPSLQVILFCIAIGRDPRDLPIGIVNMDRDFNVTAFSQNLLANARTLPMGLARDQLRYASGGVMGHRGSFDSFEAAEKVLGFNAASHEKSLTLPVPCNEAPHPLLTPLLGTKTYNFGNNFVSYISDSQFSKHYYQSADEALHETRKGNVWGYIAIPPDYTQNVFTRLSHPTNTSGALIEGSTIRYRLDMSSQQIELFVQMAITNAFSQLVDANIPDATELVPLQPGDPVYGEKNARFTDFIAPGIIITISFSQSIGLTAVSFVMDQRSGNMDRSWAAGIRASELMISHIITQFFILFGQVGLLLVFGIYVFALPHVGSILLVFVVCLTLGMTGMMYGLVIAANVSGETEALQAAMGSFFPALLLSGVIWPIEAIPVPLNYVSYILPTTWAADAGRSIMSRGWGMDHKQIWLSFLVSFAWMALFFILGLRGLKSQK